MPGVLDKLATWLGLKKRTAEVLCIGLDNSGKTTILNHLKPDKVPTDSIVPTVGFKVEQFKASGITMTVFDMSGQGRYRSIWEAYYRSVQAVIFVLDSGDQLRLVVAKDELQRMLQHEDIVPRNIPILVFANKMDSRNALSVLECAEALALETIKNKSWHIVPSNALTGQGLRDGVQWLTEALRDMD